MDDGLVLIKGMNPRIQNKFVLILIVVDDGLVPYSLMILLPSMRVLILIVVDDGLVLTDDAAAEAE